MSVKTALLHSRELENSPNSDLLIDTLCFAFLVFEMYELPLSTLTWDQLQERKQESSRVVTEAWKTNQRPLSWQKEHPLQTCSTPIHFLCSRSVFLHWLICCWLLESRVTVSMTCCDSGAFSRWVHRKQFDLLMRPLPSPSQLKRDGPLQERLHQMYILSLKTLLQLKF